MSITKGFEERQLAMMQIVEPDFYLRVGIKEGRVVEVDWSGAHAVHMLSVATNREDVVTWLKNAVSFLERKK